MEVVGVKVEVGNTVLHVMLDPIKLTVVPVPPRFIIFVPVPVPILNVVDELAAVPISIVPLVIAVPILIVPEVAVVLIFTVVP